MIIRNLGPHTYGISWIVSTAYLVAFSPYITTRPTVTFSFVLFYRLLAYHAGQCFFAAVWDKTTLETGVRGGGSSDYYDYYE